MSPNQISTDVEQYGYYLPDWLWAHPSLGLMKSMLLFFDKLTLALPEALVDETINRDPELAIPLADKGLLVNIDPSDILDPQTARTLAETLAEVVAETPWHFRKRRQRLASPHYGDIGQGDEAVKNFEDMLTRRGLMKIVKRNASVVKRYGPGSGDFRLVQLDPRVRLLVLTVFAQVFRSRLLDRGIIVHPVTNSSDLSSELNFILRRTRNRMFHEGRGQQTIEALTNSIFRDGEMYSDQLSADLVDVGTDLSAVPLDEVLDFRRENMSHYVAYASGLREFLVTQASLHPTEQSRARHERTRQIQEQAAELRRISRSAFGIRSAGLFFALVGAAWTAKQGDVFGSILAGLAASAQAVPVPEPTVTSYSYILMSSRIR